MTKKHVWRVKKEYFRQLKSGEKSLEIRVGYSQIKKVRQGDTITFENYGPNEFDVKRVAVYDSFKRMLEVEGVDHVLPGMTFNGALRTLQKIYSKDKESLGVYVFELKFKTDEKPSREFYKVSDLLKAGENKKFAKIIAEAYMVTDWICKDYPDHCDHFFSKYVPGIFDGEREIIACYIYNKIAAVAILKKDTEERMYRPAARCRARAAAPSSAPRARRPRSRSARAAGSGSPPAGTDRASAHRRRGPGR